MGYAPDHHAELPCSVIIPNLNSPLIGAVLDALRRQTVLPQEILVVGLDEPGQVREDDLVRLVSTGQPVSPAVARNIGARMARGDILLYLDADCLALPDWIETLLAWHTTGFAVVGGGIALEHDDYWRLCDNLVAFTPFLDTTPPGPRPYLPSLNFSIRSDLLAAFNGFDERFPFPSGEDTDLCFRLRQAGYTLHFEPQARVIHRHLRSSPGDLWRHLSRYGTFYYHIYPRYRELLGPWHRIRLGGGRAGTTRAAAPALAVLDVLESLVHQPHLLRYAHALPGMLLGRIAWYNGVAACSVR